MSATTSPTLQQLYDEAFDRYGAKALWRYRRHARPTAPDAEAVARALRTYGDLAAVGLAEQIEKTARAAD
jgi:hypothetical protein